MHKDTEKPKLSFSKQLTVPMSEADEIEHLKQVIKAAQERIQEITGETDGQQTTSKSH